MKRIITTVLMLISINIATQAQLNDNAKFFKEELPKAYEGFSSSGGSFGGGGFGGGGFGGGGAGGDW